jgi:ketosteroid isomerase-like protein
MSEENVEIVRRAVAAYYEGDEARAFEMLAPDIGRSRCSPLTSS